MFWEHSTPYFYLILKQESVILGLSTGIIQYVMILELCYCNSLVSSLERAFLILT